MNFWLMKCEPSVFSFEDLLKSPQKTTHWEGVRNYQARNFMRDQFKVGDRAFFYHSNTDEPGVVGILEIVKAGYPDKFALNSKSRYFDADAKKKGKNPWYLVDVKAIGRFSSVITLNRMKQEKGLANMKVLQKGSRLSIQPVTEKEFNIVCGMEKWAKV